MVLHDLCTRYRDTPHSRMIRYKRRMSERVMSGKLAILQSEIEPLTQVCGTPFRAL